MRRSLLIACLALFICSPAGAYNLFGKTRTDRSHQALSGKWIKLRRYGKGRVFQQTTSLSMHSRQEQKLIERLFRMERDPKFTSRKETGLALGELLLDAAAKAAWRNKPRESSFLRSLASKLGRKLLPEPRVEAGAWRITLKDGRVVAGMMTSSAKEAIYGLDIDRSINGLLEHHRVTNDRIARIQFFHTHPSAKGLSQRDIHKATVLRDRYGVPVEMHAVCSSDKSGFIGFKYIAE
jgi:hypothetical protein